jgi:hypothetical protein
MDLGVLYKPRTPPAYPRHWMSIKLYTSTTELDIYGLFGTIFLLVMFCFSVESV